MKGSKVIGQDLVPIANYCVGYGVVGAMLYLLLHGIVSNKFCDL